MVVICYVCIAFALVWNIPHQIKTNPKTTKNSTPHNMANKYQHRGVSGFDSLGHGHYFANYPGSHNSPAHPALPQNGPNQQAPPRPFQHQNGQHETSGHSQHHQQPHNSYDSDSLSHSSGSSGSNSGKGSYDNNWHYINSNDRNPVSHGSHAGGQGHGQSGQGQSYGSHSQDKETTQR